MATLIQQYTNHIGFVVDSSGSMHHLSKEVVDVFDSQIAHLRRRSIELNQETRVSVYLFSDKVRCVVFDMDVMRPISMKSLYVANGGTSLMDATGQGITDMRRIPELYSDHAFLFYVLTDGEENQSKNYTSSKLNSFINSLPDNWTVACLVPNATGKFEAKKFGFPEGNIEVWSTTSIGIETIGKTMTSATDTFMQNRAQGIRSTKNLFKVDMTKVSSAQITKALQELKKAEYAIYSVGQQTQIRPFVETMSGKLYVKGCAYYKLSKTEEIQGYKEIAVRNRKNNKVYSGPNARQVIGLPNHDMKVAPGDHGDWDIFVQSTSVNRKLMPGNEVMVVGV